MMTEHELGLDLTDAERQAAEPIAESDLPLAPTARLVLYLDDIGSESTSSEQS